MRVAFHVKHDSCGGLPRGVEEQLQVWEVSLHDEQREKLGTYAGLLSSYQRANVVGTRELDRLWTEHLLDSLSCLLHPTLGKAQSLIDVGSGGGLPGIPLHVALGLQRLCLLESTGKKVEFLRYAARELGLEGAEAVDGRAEEVGRERGYRGKFDIVTVRAVAPLDVILEYGMPFLRKGGDFLAMKGDLKQGELDSGKRAAIALGGELQEVIEIPFSEEIRHKERRLVVVRKTGETPKGYPRRIGTPRKAPLGGSG